MTKYFTNIAENELGNEWVRNPYAYATTPFNSYQDFGKGVLNIIGLPCKSIILAITSLIESVINYGCALYFYCRSLNDLAIEHSTNGQHCGYIGLKTLILFLASLLYVLMFLSRLLSTFWKWNSDRRNGYTPVSDTSLHAVSNQNDESISRALDEYTDLIEKAKSDRDNIWQILSEYDAEFTAHMSCIAAEHPKLSTSKVIVPGVTHFQKKTNTMSKLECARFTQLLNHYRELAKTYPIDGFINWSTSEAEANLTLSMVEEAYANYEAHHEKLLSVAEELLTESGITVQRARNVIKEIRERDKQVTIRGVSYV